MLLAVLEKRFGVRVSSSDVFLNIAGGLKPEDPATDLGIICAIVSSSEDIPVSPEICFAGEVGLSGEIRPVNRIEQRIAEAAKLGFKKFILSRHHKIPDQTQIELIPSSTVQETLNYIFS
jgi:DNA repair protein RadA/Sms